jgi:hypothetical protein
MPVSRIETVVMPVKQLTKTSFSVVALEKIQDEARRA